MDITSRLLHWHGAIFPLVRNYDSIIYVADTKVHIMDVVDVHFKEAIDVDVTVVQALVMDTNRHDNIYGDVFVMDVHDVSLDFYVYVHKV